ncbi:GDSL-type esterase/lipase family protein [Actinokineospora xionganensis]|uniref:SGNH/GDSL hydrolase family protein n=1 Tax=Actinokineospora xionganensis TaxID=2684470 RepID=A0ABR7L321_9PSEU|nr:GDSL-type esterase/lipase family protein [Actinokineospora xionganensis]MBC6446903.1 SGNH/GDSL hydrolase family protein [Actinokineospora xionganensis]
MRATLAAAALLPVLAVQGLTLRRTIPRLPGAEGPTTGTAGAGEPLRLAVLGESTAAGVGARTHDVGLAGRLAAALAGRGHAVSWQVSARIGADAHVTRTELAPALDPADVVVVVLGVNDVIEFHTAARWTRDLLRLLIDLRARHGRTVLAGVPPMARFPALPRPLRSVLGLRAAELDAAAARIARRVPGVAHVPLPHELIDGDLFCVDRFHPSESGYALWADGLADAVSAAPR